MNGRSTGQSRSDDDDGLGDVSEARNSDVEDGYGSKGLMSDVYKGHCTDGNVGRSVKDGGCIDETAHSLEPLNNASTDQTHNVTTANIGGNIITSSVRTSIDESSGKITVLETNDQVIASKIEEIYVKNDAPDNSATSKVKGSDSKSVDTRNASKSDKLAANISAKGGSDIRSDTKPKLISDSATDKIPRVGFVGVKPDRRKSLAEYEPKPSTSKDEEIVPSSSMSDRSAHSLKMAWLEAHSSQSKSQKYSDTKALISSHSTKYEEIQPPRIGHSVTGTSDSKLNLRGDYVVQFKPVTTTRVFEKRTKKSELERKVSKDGENLEGGTTKVDNSKPKKLVDLSNVKSPEKKETNLGKRLHEYDIESQNSYDHDKKKTYKDRIKNISAKIINPCIETIKIVTGNEPGESSEDSSSSLKTSVVITEETDLSDENQSICTDSESEKHDTARKISSGSVTLKEAKLQKDIDALEESQTRDDFLEKDAILSADRSQDSSKHLETKSERKDSVMVKITSKRKPVSDECSEIQTSEDNLSPFEDDDYNIALHLALKTESVDDISLEKRKLSRESLSSSEEKNLVAFESDEIKSEKHKDRRRKHGLTSSEESITLKTKSKSESETDTKESWVEYKSESTVSKRGLTSSEESSSFCSSKSDEQKVEVDISNRDRIQNFISDTKTVMSRVIGVGIAPEDREGIDGIELRPLRPVVVSESEESGISADTDSSSTTEIQRISERLLPIGGNITLIKGKPPSERSTTPSWSSVSSLLDGLTWEKTRFGSDNEHSDRSITSSPSTFHRVTPIQELMTVSKETPQKSKTVTPPVEIKPQIREKRTSESDTSSEESQQHQRITCEQVIRGAQSDNEEVFMTAHYCIDSLTYGIRRSLSEEKLFSLEADTQAHREKKTIAKVAPLKNNVFSDKACDACTFLVLLQTLIVRERAIHFAFRKVDACLVHNIGLGSQNAHIYRYLLKKMPSCEFCTFPSVEKMILQLVQFRHGVLMHKADNIAPIYVIFPPYSENNRTIGRVVHLKKKKVSDYAVKPRLRVMIADRYILFPKFHDTSVWVKSALKRHDTPTKKMVSKIKSKTVPIKMDDIPELNESMSEEMKPKTVVEHKTIKETPIIKRPSKRKAKKCVLKKWSVEMAASNVQPTRRNGSSSDEPKASNVGSGSKSNEVVALNNKRRRCVLKKWTIKLSPKSKRKLSFHKYQELVQDKSLKQTKSVVTDKSIKTKSQQNTTTSKGSDTSQLDHKHIDGVVLVRKKRPWWKCPKKKKPAKAKPVEPTPKKKPDFYKKFLHPSYQQPLFSYRVKSRTGQIETRVLTRQDLLAQRLAYHYIRQLTVGRTEPATNEEELKVKKPALTDFQSQEYEKRRTFIRGSRESSEQRDEPIKEEVEDKDIPQDLASNYREPESPLDVTKYDPSQIDYHFENCRIIQEGKTPHKQFLKLQQVYKTTDFEDSWIEYHVEDCSYFMIDGTTVTDIDTINLVLAEKKDETCDCAEKLIKGGNIYVKDKSSHTFHHDLCLLFPKQLESGAIDLQGLFNPNIPSREFDENDVLRFYFISKHTDTKDTRLVDFCDVPMSKFNEVQENIKFAFSVLRNEVETMSHFYSKDDSDLSQSDVPSDEKASTFALSPRAHRTMSLDDNLPNMINPPQIDLADYQRSITPPRVDSESEDSTTVYSLEDCLIYASEYMTDDSLSPTPESLGVCDQIHKRSESSTEIGFFRQLTPSPRLSDQGQPDKSVDSGSAKVSPRQERSSDKQIYYHLGEFTTQIQKGISLDQRVASPKPLETQYDSEPTSRLTSPDKHDGPKLGDKQRPMTPKIGYKSDLHIPRRVQSQDATAHHIQPPRNFVDRLRLGHSLDSMQRKRGRSQENLIKATFDTLSLRIEDSNQRPRPAPKPKLHDFGQETYPKRQETAQDIHSEEFIHTHCTCKVLETMELAKRVVAYFEENIERSPCPYHDAFYQAETSKYRAFSQGDLSINQRRSFLNQGGERLRQCLSLYDQGFDPDLNNAPPRREPKTQCSYPPYENTRVSCPRSRSQDMPSTSQTYSLDAVVSPTRVMENLRQDSTGNVEQLRIINQRTRSHGDLRSKRLSIFNQESKERAQKFSPERLCMKAVLIPGIDREHDQCVPQESLKDDDSRHRHPHSFRDQWTVPRHRDRLKTLPDDTTQGRATKKPGSNKDNDDSECPHLWKKWRDGSAPF